jgi:hypothetical protein
MASFGLERPLDNPALSAVRAALKVQESCAWLNCRDEFRKAVMRVFLMITPNSKNQP